MTAPACSHCARASAGVWFGYLASCEGCAARAVARSLCAFEAVRTRQSADLRAVLARVLPAVPYEQARALVWDWWRIDHKRNGDHHDQAA